MLRFPILVFASLLIAVVPGCSSDTTTAGDPDVGVQEMPGDTGGGDEGTFLTTVRAPKGYDEFGGVKDLPLTNDSGFFRPVLSDGRWWLATPAGHAFLSLGVNHIDFTADKSVPLGYSSFQKVNVAWYGSGAEGKLAFYEEALAMLQDLGFNTVAAWSGEVYDRISKGTLAPMPYSVILGFAGSTDAPAVNGDGFPDVFHPDFEAGCLTYAQQKISQAFKDDPYLIGYYIDNELRWWGEGKYIPVANRSLADDFIAQPPETPAKEAFRDFLFEDRGYTVETLNQAWGTAFGSKDDVAIVYVLNDDSAYPAIAADKAAFVGKVAETYFAVIDAAVDTVDPNHLNLCARFSVASPDEVVKAARHCDVLTINDYFTEGEELTDLYGADSAGRWVNQALLAGEGGQPKPVMLTEFGLRAMDSGLPNGFGAGWTTQTQAERAAYYRRTLDKLMGLEAAGVPFVVGFHWFEYADEPKLGRFDTEDGNYGFVTVDGSPYLTFHEGLRAANEWIWDRLLGGDAVVLDAPGGLESQVAAHDATLTWDPVPGATGYRVVVAPSPAFVGVVAREDWGGAECDGPHDLFVEADQTSVVLTEPLAAGTWYWAVSARNPGRAIDSDYSAPGSFEVEPACVEGHGKESVRCFEMPPPNEAPYNVDGTVSVSTLNFSVLDMDVPDAVFIANSLGVNHPVTGGEGAEVALVRNFPEPLEGSPASDRFCPAAVVDNEGKLVSAATLVHVRHVTPYGKVIIDRPLDPNGTVEPFSCSFPIKSGDEPVARKIYYIDTSDPLLPADVRIEVQLH